MPFELRKRDTYGCTRMPKMTLGVKWSQVQILSARPRKPALTSAGAGFVLLEFLADVWQWTSSVPSGREWADFLGKQCSGGGAQVIALGMGVDR
jgi:hypothetical protein